MKGSDVLSLLKVKAGLAFELFLFSARVSKVKACGALLSLTRYDKPGFDEAACKGARGRSEWEFCG